MDKDKKDKAIDLCSIKNAEKEFGLEKITNFYSDSNDFIGTGIDKNGKNYKISGKCDGKLISKKEDPLKDILNSHL
ncbi:MAG: hypothetical protein EU529_06975 [Promethearchaeota archaeon]|nr:MAG: hypothetical protein EU540_03080 [Candidatus Lokiarchaeota archaeon]TFG23591.1 MAG: hypothetical protein EU529_06975 [Candidatus Lokiarchaeota archaeon]